MKLLNSKRKSKNGKNNLIKKYKNKRFIKRNLYFNISLLLIIILFFFPFSTFLIFVNYFYKSRTNNNNMLLNKKGDFEVDMIPPEKYERNILDEIKTKIIGKPLLTFNELYFINGLIRKYKPKKIIEIGVCTGGTSAAILNAIKDIEGAKLYSCDLEKSNYLNNKYEVGYIVKNYFPELLKNWKLFTGNTTSAFIEEIGGDIDFAFIDTAHVMPGEVLNIIEILPFLKKNAIISFDDIAHHSKYKSVNLKNFHACNNLLFSVLRGKKIIFEHNSNKTFDFPKLGAVILDDNQEKYFYEYFYLLTNSWSYMPNKFEIDAIRYIVEKYYDPFLLSMFDKAVELNYNYLKFRGLLNKDYILYTFKNVKRKNPFNP